MYCTTNNPRSEIHTETTALLYAPTYAFYGEHSGPVAISPEARHMPSSNQRFLDATPGPARYLRDVRVTLGHISYHRGTTWPPPTTWNDDPLIYIESFLQVLARSANCLQRLEVDVTGRNAAQVRPQIWQCYDLPAPTRFRHSWLDPPLYLGPVGPEGEEMVEMLTERELLAVLEYVAPGEAALQGRIREKLYDSVVHAPGPLKSCLWAHLFKLESQKIFMGYRLVGILKRFGPALRTFGVEMGGDQIVEEAWMAAVREKTGLEVRVAPIQGARYWQAPKQAGR